MKLRLLSFLPGLGLWGPLLLPLLGCCMATAWLGFAWAQQGAVAPPPSGQVVLAALLALGMLLLLLVMAVRAARQWRAPWVRLAQEVQQVQLGAGTEFSALAQARDAPPELRGLAQALSCWFEKAHAESDAQQRFIADAAHQLRTPLAALQSQVEAWALKAQAEPSQSITLGYGQVEQLRRASRRTTQLAQQLLLLSRVESGHAGTHQEVQRVDIKNLCEDLFESFLDQALAKDLDLGLEAKTAHVSGQEWLLREMISNILDNAIKYTPPRGQITLRCGLRADARGACGRLRVFVEVEDNGPGVDASEYLHLTKRFYRLAGNAADGSGLGLAIVQHIAQAHRAQLHFGCGANGRGLRVLLVF